MTNVTDILPQSWRPYAKALVTVLVVFLTSLGTVISDGITAQEWITVSVATLTGGGAAYGTRNDTD